MIELSIITPTIRWTYQIELTLNNLYFAADHLPEFEVIIVFDGQPVPQEARFAVRDLPNVKLLSMDRAGPAAARNFAASWAKGNQLLFADSDVVLFDETIRRLCLQRPSTIQVPKVVGIDDNNISKFFSEFVLATRKTKWGKFAASACWALRKEDFETAGRFDEKFKFPAGEDYEFCQRWSVLGFQIVDVPEVTVLHSNPTSLSSLLRKAVFYGKHTLLSGSDSSTGEQRATYVDLLCLPFVVLSWVPVSLYLVVTGANHEFIGRLLALQRQFLRLASRLSYRRGFGWLHLAGRIGRAVSRLNIALTGPLGVQGKRLGEDPRMWFRALVLLWTMAIQVGSRKRPRSPRT